MKKGKGVREQVGPGRPRGASERLAGLGDEERQFFLKLRAREVSRNRSVEMLYEAYPESKRYSVQSFRFYELSDVGKAALADISQGVADEAVRVSFSQRGIRVETLTNVARVLLDRLYAEDRKGEEANVQSIVKLSAELRSTLSTIRDEVDPLNASDSQILSSFEAFFRERQRMFSDQMKKKVGSLPEWNTQAPEIQEN